MAFPENPYQPPTTEVPFSASNDADRNRLATLGERLGAQLIDVLILLALVMPLQWSMGVFGNYAAYAKNYMAQSLWGLGGTGVVLALNSYFWATRAQSIGKMIVGTKIVALDGSNASLSLIILRRVLPISLVALIPGVGSVVGLIDAVAIFRNDRRCVHDLIAGTRVVRA